MSELMAALVAAAVLILGIGLAVDLFDEFAR